jgi:protoporphyrinogen oxidase
MNTAHAPTRVPLRDGSRVVIVGAGPTGLGAAWHLHASGFTGWQVLESADGPGGLAGSVGDAGGFTWDYGGHVAFSDDARFDALLDRVLPDGLLRHTRSAWVYMAGRFIPFPLQFHIHRLPDGLRTACMEGLRTAARAHPAPAPDFGAWAERTFGRGLVDVFLRPYNEKLWQCPLRVLGTQWVDRRLAVESPAALLRRAEEGADGSAWGPNRPFRFPRAGGTGAIWRGLAANLPAGRVRYRARVSSVDTRTRRLRLTSGEEIPFDVLVSTMPLTTLAAACAPAPLPDVAPALRHTSALVLGFGLRGATPATMAGKHWIYAPSPDLPFYRLTVFSNYAPANVPGPDPHWSMLVELSFPGGADAAAAAPAATRARDALAGLGWLDPTRLASTWQAWIGHSYPVPTPERDAVLRRWLPALRENGIFSRGRFGAWQYETGNMDHCYAQGVELAEHLLTGQPERLLRIT